MVDGGLTGQLDWSSVVDAEPAGIAVSDGRGRLVYVNEAAARVLGSTAESLVGVAVEDVLPPGCAPARRMPTGEAVWYLADGVLLDRSRDRFAAEVSDALAGTLNLRRTLGRVIDLVVPRLGRWAAVTTWDNDRIRQVSRGPGPALDDRAIPARRLDDAGRKRIQHAIEVDHSRTMVSAAAELQEMGASEGAARALLADGPVEVLTAALRSHGAPVAILSAIPHPGTDTGLLAELAPRAAVALSMARVYEERSTLASTLRNALVPVALPEPPGLRLGSAYRPALEATEIGGDFYEVRSEDPGWSFSIGDVCGKGVEAAILTGQVRQSLSTVSLVSADPAERLRLLNGALLRTDGTSFVTVLHGVVQPGPDSASIRLAGGGHPPPLLRRNDGRVEEVAVAGPIIGMLPEVRFCPASFRLEKGETLVCYTDGISEARGGDGMFGVEGIQRVIADCAGMTAQAVAERIQQEAIEHLDGRPHDDMAVLALQVAAP